jgi:hypothetical protein
VNVRLLIVIDDELPFVSVTAFAPPVLPIATEYQLRLVGETVTAAVEPPVPSPVSETFWGLELSESLKFSVAVRVPATVGAKTMFAVQLAEAASVVPQVLL